MSSCTTSPGSRKRLEFMAVLLGNLNTDNYHEGVEVAYVL
jgi:hypothetical protein